jgi:putative RNA 2'-phosphotransferase
MATFATTGSRIFVMLEACLRHAANFGMTNADHVTRDLIKSSKFLSLVLRHQPERIGLMLDQNGWADVDDLIARAGGHGVTLTRELVAEIVATSDKQRFALDPAGKRIRANQGHSVDIDLDLAPSEPPAILFHGTAARNLAAIRSQGLKPGNRQHVHLSRDEATAIKVGQRHGRPVVLRVFAGKMWQQGSPFFCSANGVWLTPAVPPEFIEFADKPD